MICHSLALETESEILAKALMREIMLDNGAINAMELDEPKRYPAKHVRLIGDAATAFFQANSGLCNDEIITLMADASEDDPLFSRLQGWKDLNNALNNYFCDGL